jgi:hypothetical protein
MPTTHGVSATILDYSEETSNFKFHIGAITALNIAGVLAQIGDWRNALGNIITGVLRQDTVVLDRNTYTNTPPADTTSQVELKWLLTYEGNTSKKKFRTEIATPDTSKLIPGTDKADLTDTDIAAYITAFEALAKSPDDDAEGVNVLDMRLVGRNV